MYCIPRAISVAIVITEEIDRGQKDGELSRSRKQPLSANSVTRCRVIASENFSAVTLWSFLILLHVPIYLTTFLWFSILLCAEEGYERKKTSQGR